MSRRFGNIFSPQIISATVKQGVTAIGVHLHMPKWNLNEGLCRNAWPEKMPNNSAAFFSFSLLLAELQAPPPSFPY